MARSEAAEFPTSGASRLALSARQVRLVEGASVLAAVAILLASVLPNLSNHPAITDDEVWVMSAAYKLAEEGVFGSDMFAGFYNADRAYLLNMPGHHFLVAGSFKLFGAGVFQARLVSVAYGVATLVLAFLLARRLYGTAAGVLTLGLLLFLRLNMGFDTGLPLQELSSSIRYDLAPVPFMLGAVLVLLGGTTWRRAAIAGALLGIATLLQFYGAFGIPVAAAFLLSEPLRRVASLKLVAVLIAASGLVCLPYGVYILAHFDDFRGQVGTVDRRDDLSAPSFYVNSVLNEPDRFVRPLGFRDIPRGEDPQKVKPRFLSPTEMATRRPSAKIGVLIGFPLAVGFTAWRAFRERSRGDRLLFATLAGLALQFALLDSLKLYIYWIPVVPFLCVGVAAACLRLLRPPAPTRWSYALAAGTAACLLLVFAEGSYARATGFRAANKNSDYEAVGERLKQYIPPGSKVVGSTNLWWPLRDTEYRSYFLFFYLTADNAGPYKTSITQFLDEFQPDYLVITRLAAGELAEHLITPHLHEYQQYLDDHAVSIANLYGPGYQSFGFIDIWKFEKP